MRIKLFLLLLLPLGVWAQNPACTQKGTLTAATVFTPFQNNSANPNCNAFALTWNSTGFSALSIQLQGSDDNVTYTAFTGATTVLVGANPSTALSGAILIQASSKIAFLQVKVNSVSSTGGINFQLYGYSGVTPVAKLSGGGSTSWASITAGTNTNGFLQVGSPSVLEPTGASPGGIYATQVVDGHDLAAITVLTPGAGSSTDTLQVQPGTVIAPTVQVAARGFDSNVSLDLLSKGTGVVHLGSLNAFVDAAGNMTVVSCTGCPQGTVTSVYGNAGPAIVALSPTGSNSLDASGMTSANGLKVPVIAGAAPSANGAIAYDSTNNNPHIAQNGADAKLATYTATPGNGNCANWVNSGGVVKLGDAGAACGSGGGAGGGVLTYSGPTQSILSGTAFCPVGGGGACSATETTVDIDSAAVSTVSNMYVQFSQALGAGNSVVVTWRKNASSQTTTCTISGASATSCNDTTHSFAVAQGDLLDYQLVFSGTIVVTPTLLIMSQFGTVNAGITSIFGSTGPVVGAIGDLGATGSVLGVKGVPLCTGFTPLTGQNLQYSTALSPNPCYTAATGGGAGPSASAYNSTGQSFSSGDIKMTFDTNLWDTCPSCTIHSTSTNTSRFTAPSTGYYQASCGLSQTGSAGFGISIRINGSAPNGYAAQAIPAGISGGNAAVTAIIKLTSGDYMECNVNPSSPVTGTANLNFGQLTKLSTTF